jgi:hypothetical protein
MYPSEVFGYICALDQQHIPGDEPDSLAQDIFAPSKQVILNTLMNVWGYGQILCRYFVDNPARLLLMSV